MSNNESSNSYNRIVYLLGDVRLISCCDDLQWITQYLKGGYWRSRSYHTEINTIARDEPMLDLADVIEAIARDSNQRLIQSQKDQRSDISVL